MDPQKKVLRTWLAWACGVSVDRVTDEHIDRWLELRSAVQAYKPTPEQAKGVRALAHVLGVRINPDR